ncbi:hypothetical protein B7495_18485 (plasmid) [Cryobacterium sp. LW097]|uniref:hypothetical protein n=1 Tax=unclassified Cryobacterium TaxID=2649013 RepID=UPI000B4DDF9E|nr:MULTISPECIES: hypothetical protein [unclassified Cryobacterium]ASD24265.1 hypothetical protein B7495_18485 [Cryobacterium sp. LW097]TFC52836.1 hypothetical protein E3O68_13130 [Cryobacterium sp. TMB3-1-2]TFC62223.1 hypothetical protein E3O60_02760 [Cryobacterium sp. TMB1-7]TFC70686.1 hypothetical protein E3T21_09745 [Cryobacterium sp. TMB3-15]TFC75412.1 hypothetical protein E3T22_12315 [Cryobacterium sp. TMB3-10]
MAEEADGIGDAFDGQMRVALTVATQMAERFARLREELARNAQARTEQQTKELQARFDAERNAARASLAPVQQQEWWNTAGVDDIATAYETANAWRTVDPDIARTSDRMSEELRGQYGIDVNNLDADPLAVREALARAQQDRSAAAESRGESGKDYAEAASLLTVADQLDRKAEERDRDQKRAENTHDEPTEGLSRKELTGKADVTRDNAANAYDSAGRRESFAADMEKSGVDPQLEKVRLVADRENGTHASAAVATKPGKQPKSRTNIKAAGLQRERGGLSR